MSSSSKYIFLATSRLSTIKAKITQHRDDLSLSASGSDIGNAQQNWKQWAEGKMTMRRSRKIQGRILKEEVVLFPGWAARRYRDSKEAFEVDVFVSGYASARRPPGLASRSQRAFLRLAKGFASLPKLVSDPDSVAPLPFTPATENILSSIHLPPRPSEMTEEYEIKVLERQFCKLNFENQDNDSVASSSTSIELDIPPPASSSSSTQTHRPKGPYITGDLRRLHANLESRLQPFWSTALSARTVRIKLFASSGATGNESTPHHHHHRNQETDDHDNGPLASQDVQTAANGFFSTKLTVSWEELCHHPGATHIAFGDPGAEHDIHIEVDLLPSVPTPEYMKPGASFASDLSTSAVQGDPEIVSSQTLYRTPSVISTPLTHCPIRVISDIDDTIKISNILSGARAVFRNVFVKELSETTIPGMGEWYDEMWKRGVRFHYVSNGPFELLPVVKEFIHVSRLPPGSIKLRSYSGRSLFNGLLSAPASRKRVGVVEILDSFPSSRFILVGDTGEQDLELYAALAAERPGQIVGVFVRDANATEATDSDSDATGAGAADTAIKINSIEDPTGFAARAPNLNPNPNPTPLPPDASGYFTSGPLSSEPETYSPHLTGSPPSNRSPLLTPTPAYSPSPPSSAPPSLPSSPPPPPPPSRPPLSSRSSLYSLSSSSRPRKASLPEPEKRRYELQTRVWRARILMPGHIPLRVFRRPQECVEAWEILERFFSGRR